MDSPYSEISPRDEKSPKYEKNEPRVGGKRVPANQYLQRNIRGGGGGGR